MEGEQQFENEPKFYGNRGNLVHPEAIRCELHFEETVPSEAPSSVTATSLQSLSTD